MCLRLNILDDPYDMLSLSWENHASQAAFKKSKVVVNFNAMQILQSYSCQCVKTKLESLESSANQKHSYGPL